MDARLPAGAGLLFLSFCLPVNAWNPHLDILSPALIRYRTRNLRSTNRQPKKLGSNPTDHSLWRFTLGLNTMMGCFLVLQYTRGRAKCRSMVQKIDRSSNICAVSYFRGSGSQEGGWLLIGVLREHLRGRKQTAGSKKKQSSSSGFRPPNSKTQKKNQKNTTTSKKKKNL